MALKLVRHLVLDNEAAQALGSSRTHDRRRASVVTAIMAANGNVNKKTGLRDRTAWGILTVPSPFGSRK